jgi:hypothetical protein
VTGCSCTQSQSGYYWSATNVSSDPGSAWQVFFYNGTVINGAKTFNRPCSAWRSVILLRPGRYAGQVLGVCGDLRRCCVPWPSLVTRIRPSPDG